MFYIELLMEHTRKTPIRTLCTFSLGLSFNRPKIPRHKAVCDKEAKATYLEQAQQFAQSLAEGLGEQDGLFTVCFLSVGKNDVFVEKYLF